MNPPAPTHAPYLLLQKYNVVWPPTNLPNLWLEGTIILDNNYDVWVCTASGAPGSWQKLSGGGAAVNFYPENLTSQIDGVTDTFTTNAGTPRQLGTLRVYFNGLDQGTPGSIQTGAVVEEISQTQFKLSFVPESPDQLHVTYFG